MPVFLGIHKLPEETTEEQAREGWGKYKQSATEKGLKPLGVVVSIEKGFAYCQTEAESADQVKDAHQVVEIPLEDVIEVQRLE